MARVFTWTVVVYDTMSDFPATGDVDVIYIDASKNTAYRYDVDYYAISSAEVDIWGALGSVSKGGGGGGGALWGNITGTLSSQTDLQSALDAKQDDLVSGTNIKTINSTSLLGSGNISVQPTLTLTTTGTSGAATLVGSTLNIPQYSGGGSSPITNLGIGTTGTTVTGTTANTITQSVLIPANTLAANNTLDFIARFSKTGVAGGGTYRVYINTSNSLTGATLFANLYAVSVGATIQTHQNQRTFFYNGTTLSSNAGGTSNVTDILQFTTAGYTMTYNSATDYYLIFAIQLSNSADSSVINGFRVLKYA